MNKVLKRKMFTVPKQNHKGTGIASGLLYRPGYAIGGRVGFKKGLLVNDEALERAASSLPSPIDDSTLNFNPNLSIDTTSVDNLGKAQQQASKLLKNITPIDYDKFAIDYGKYATDYSKYKTDYSKYEPSKLGAFGEAAAMTIKERIPVGQSQVANFVANLSQTSKQYKKEIQDLAKLTEKEEKELKLKAEADAKKMQMLTDTQANELRIKSEENILESEYKNSALATELYKINLADSLQRDKINKEKEGKVFNIDRTMQIIDENTRSGVNFKDLPTESQDELIRFNRMDELQNNRMTQAITAYNDKYMEDYTMDPESPVLTDAQLEQKRKGLVQYMNSLFPSIDFDLIFRAPENTAMNEVINAFEAYFPNLSEQDKKIIEDNKTDVLFDQYITLLDKQKEGNTSVKTTTGGVVPIQDAIELAISQIEARYPSLNLGG